MKNKKFRKIAVSLLIFSMVGIYGYFPLLRSAAAVDSIMQAKDTISDSDAGVVATHTFTFTTGTTTPTGGYWLIDFNNVVNGFSGQATGSLSCAYGAANIDEDAYADGQVFCRMTAPLAATTTQVAISDVTNPMPGSEGVKYIWVYLYDASGTVLERVQLAVFIIQDVLVTARVDSFLNFTINGVAADAKTVNGVNCDETTTATNTPFGTLVINATTTVCQRLNVTTNATEGYVVTVHQDHELLSDGGANINSFNNSPDNTGSSTPEIWQHPKNILDTYNTYGHMGLTSDDDDGVLLGNDYYQGGVAYYVGLNSTDPVAIMAHDGPSDGTTQNIGESFVAYSVQVASLQEAGDYESTLTYICTPTF